MGKGSGLAEQAGKGNSFSTAGALRLGGAGAAAAAMLAAMRGLVGGGEAAEGPVLSVETLGFPFECESPFLFAVYHLDHYPPGGADMGPGAAALKGRALGSDFGNPSGWSMYHGERIPGFPKHPHRGFETITVTRRGWIDHTDSLGNAGRFGGGDVQWMTAGRGINHAEMFPLLEQSGENVLELFQIWINLPRRSKMVEPSFKMLWAESLATEAPETAASSTGAGAEVRLVAGELPGFPPPPAPPPDSYASDPSSDVLVATVRLEPGASWTLPRYGGDGPIEGLHRNAYLYTDAAATVAGRRVPGRRRLRLKPDADAAFAADAGSPVEVLVLQGRDLGEPVVQHGPFVGNNREDIATAFKDYQRTGFGGWPWPSDALAHSRERPRFAQYADGQLEERPMP